METITLMFDYISKIDDQETRDFAQEKALLGKSILRRASQSICEMGQLLIEAKGRLEHGSFLEWVEVEFEMSPRYAQKFMRAAEAFSNANNCSHLPLSQSAIFALSAVSVSDETRTLALEKAASGEIKTTRETKEFIEARADVENLPMVAESPSSAPGFGINRQETQTYLKGREDREKKLRELSTPEEALRFFLENETYLTGQPEFLGIWKRRARRAIQG